jgi:diphthine synthase
MLYLVGLGLDLKDISLKALEVIKECDEVFLENYTITFPYTVEELEKVINKKIALADRKFVESNFFVEESKNKNVVILVYGDPLAATTHINFVRETKAKVIHAPSILTAISETGLQLYKFGKTASIPKWQDSFKPTSFFQVVKDNLSIKAHTLLLVDIGMPLKEALLELDLASGKELGNKEIIICSKLGTEDGKIISGKLSKLKSKKVKEPFSIIIPAELSFGEEIL